TAPNVTAEVNARDVLDVNRRTVLHLEDDVLNVLNFFDISAAADEILSRRDFQRTPAHIRVAVLYRADDLAQRNVIGDERVRIEIHLELLYEVAERRDFCNACHRDKRVAQIPTLNRQELRECMLADGF